MPLFLETFLQLFSRKHCCSTKNCGSQTQARDCIWIFTNSLNMIHAKQMHNLTTKRSAKFTQKCHLASLNDSSTSWSQPLPGCLQSWAWHSGRPLPGPTSQPHYLQLNFSILRLLTLWADNSSWGTRLCIEGCQKHLLTLETRCRQHHHPSSPSCEEHMSPISVKWPLTCVSTVSGGHNL